MATLRIKWDCPHGQHTATVKIHANPHTYTVGGRARETEIGVERVPMTEEKVTVRYLVLTAKCGCTRRIPEIGLERLCEDSPLITLDYRGVPEGAYI